MSPRPALVLCVLSALLFQAPAARTQPLTDLQIHGFASQGYLHSSEYDYLARSRDGSAEIQEFAVNLSTQLHEEIRVGMQLFARDLGSLGNNEVELDWAFGDWRPNDLVGLRAGRIKMPYGLYNETSDFDAVRTSVLLPQSVYDVRFRDVMMAVNGVQLYSRLEVELLGSLETSAYAGNVAAAANGSVGRLFGDAGFFTVDRLDFDHAAGAQLVWNTGIEGLRLAESFNHWSLEMATSLTPPALQMLGPTGADAAQAFTMPNVNFLTHSAEYTRGNLVLAAEHSTWKADMNNPLLQGAMDQTKWYVQGSYRLNDWFEFGSYWSRHEDAAAADQGQVEHRTHQRDLAFSARFDVSHAMIVKLEWHRIDGTAQLYQMENPSLATDPQAQDSTWNLFAAKTSFIF